MRHAEGSTREPTTDARRSGAGICGVRGWSEGLRRTLLTVCRRNRGHRERAQLVRVFWASRKPEAAATPGKCNRGPVGAVNQCQRGEDRSSRPRGSSSSPQGSSDRTVSGNTRVCGLTGRCRTSQRNHKALQQAWLTDGGNTTKTCTEGTLHSTATDGNWTSTRGSTARG